MSLKRQKAQRDAKPEMDLFRQEFPVCMVPGCTRKATAIHHICRGAHRAKAYGVRATWLSACGTHHDELDNQGIWSIVCQYSLKAICDPEHYDRVLMNEIRDTEPEAISEREVLFSILALLNVDPA